MVLKLICCHVIIICFPFFLDVCIPISLSCSSKKKRRRVTSIWSRKMFVLKTSHKTWLCLAIRLSPSPTFFKSKTKFSNILTLYIISITFYYCLDNKLITKQNILTFFLCKNFKIYICFISHQLFQNLKSFAKSIAKQNLVIGNAVWLKK